MSQPSPQRKNLTHVLNENKKLKSRVSDLEKIVNEKNKTVAELRKQIRQIQQRLHKDTTKKDRELKSQNYKKGKLEQDFKDLRKHTVVLKNKLQETDKKLKISEKVTKEQTFVITDLEKAVRVYQKELKRRGEKNQKMYRILEGLNMKNHKIQQKHLSLKKDLDKQKFEEISLSWSPHKNTILDQKRRIMDLEKTVNVANGDKSVAHGKCDKLAKELDQKNEKIRFLMEKLESQKQRVTGTSASLKKDIDKLKVMIKNGKVSKNTVEMKLKKVEKQLSIQKTRNKSELKKVDRMNARWEAVLKEINTKERDADEERRENSLTWEDRKTRRGKISKTKGLLAKKEQDTRLIRRMRVKLSECFDENWKVKEELKSTTESLNSLTKSHTILLEKSTNNEETMGTKIKELTELSQKQAEAISKFDDRLKNHDSRKRAEQKKKKDAQYKKLKNDVDLMMARNSRHFRKKSKGRRYR